MADIGKREVQVRVPPQIGSIADLAPVTGDGRTWLLLDEAGRIGRWNISTGSYEHLATTTVPEEDQEPSDGRPRYRRLHTCADGAFAAVVNDYGRYGAGRFQRARGGNGWI
jgi:hypothetical protein